MNAPPRIWCTLAMAGVEVVTEQSPTGDFETTVHGGKLDGERFVCEAAGDPESQHERACKLARMLAWPRRRRRR